MLNKGEKDFSNIKLNANLYGMDLSNISFRRSDLTNSNLSHANISGTDFSHAILQRCNFEGAVLKNTDFSNADMRNASLKNAIIENTSFKKANLMWAHLCGNNLLRADLRGAQLEWSCFIGSEVNQEQLNIMPSTALSSITKKSEGYNTILQESFSASIYKTMTPTQSIVASYTMVENKGEKDKKIKGPVC